MSNQEITKKLMCIILRNGIEIWGEEDKIKNLQVILKNTKESKFIELGEETINTADITGIFLAQTMENITRRKNGQWQDKNGQWQDKGTRACPRCGNVLPWGKQCGICQ